MKRKYSFFKPFKIFSRTDIDSILNDETFTRHEFDLHVKEVSLNLNIDESIVREVIVHYITNVMYVLNTVQKIKTKINIYGFFSFELEKGRRV